MNAHSASSNNAVTDATTLTTPSAVDLVALGVSRGGRSDTFARGFRVLVDGPVTFTTARGRDETWDLLAGEGYEIEISRITFAGSVRIFW